jgi:concanavalin A-like lectin/glucanase superfamily protein
MWKQSIHLILLTVVLALALGGPAYGAFNVLKDPALIGWWTCDEGAGADVADSSPNGNNGTFINGDPVWTTGVYGMAIELANPTLVEVPAIGVTLDAATWAGWIMPDGTQADWSSLFMHRGPGPASGFNLVASNTLAYHWNNASDTWSYRSSVALADGEWSHAAVTVTPDLATFYLNGVDSATNAVSHGSIAWDGPFWIGGDDTYGGSRSLTSAALDDLAFFSRALTGEEVVSIMGGLFDPTMASAPTPADEATDVSRDTDLSWAAGEGAGTHDVYLGTSLDDVNDGAGTLLSGGQGAATLDLDRLEFGQTYYWRVDEIGGPDGTVKGDVWSFAVEPLAYPVANIVVTTNATSEPGSGLENMVNDSGLNSDGQHSIDSADMWQGTPVDGAPIVLDFEFDAIYKLHEMVVWNYNVMFELMLGFGPKDVTVEYSENGTDWTTLGDVVLAQATARADYEANTAVDFGGVGAKYVKITINSGYGMLGQFGISEIRFLYVPVLAREPQPADGGTGVSVATDLSWRAGREAASHEVYLGTDPDALALVETTNNTSSAPGSLDLETTYYWQIVEVNEAESTPSWAGAVWSFSTQTFLVVDDFESYIDDEGGRIYETWADGWVNDTGSTVGHLSAPFAETSTVNSGRQAMPLFYDNAGVTVAEATLTLVPAQNWTTGGIQSLSLSFQGAPDNTGQLYLKINGTKIVYGGDAGDIARVQWQPWNVDLSTVGGNLGSVSEVTIGIEGAGAEGTLYVDDIRLYPQTPEFVTPVDPDPAGLVLHYALDEGSGSVASDSSGSGNNGTIEGSPAWITGVSGTALGFDGSRDYVTTGKSLLNDLTEFTIACWLKGNLSLGTRSGLVGQNDCIEYGVVSSNTIQIYTGASGAVDLSWPYDADADWHHIVAVGDGQSVTIYLDGKPEVSGGSAITDTYGTSTFPVNIGGGGIFDATDNWFTGDVDEIAIYQRALSAAEVAGLAGLTTPVTVPF